MLMAQETIQEAKVQFTLPEKWSLIQKGGTFDDGLIQYFYRREPVPTPEGTEAYPAAIFILDRVKGRTLDDFIAEDRRYEKGGRMAKGEFEPTIDVKVAGLDAKLIKVKIEDSGYRLRTLFYYFFNNDVAVKLVLNTIRDPNPALEEQEAIVKSLSVIDTN